MNRRFVIILIFAGLAIGLTVWLLSTKGTVFKSRPESLLIQTDAPCKVNIDGDEMVLLQPGSVSIEVTSGQHLVSAVSMEENVVWEELVYVPKAKQVVVNIRLAAKINAAKQRKNPLVVE